MRELRDRPGTNDADANVGLHSSSRTRVVEVVARADSQRAESRETQEIVACLRVERDVTEQSNVEARRAGHANRDDVRRAFDERAVDEPSVRIHDVRRDARRRRTAGATSSV